jgi:hypothetical protein
MPSTTTRRIGLTTAATAILLAVGVYATSARTMSMPQSALAAATSLPIGVMSLMQNAKDLPEQQYDAF